VRLIVRSIDSIRNRIAGSKHYTVGPGGPLYKAAADVIGIGAAIIDIDIPKERWAAVRSGIDIIQLRLLALATD
jgi:hypothetical protein